ncbi:GNAT family N-acetyltransferase [Leptobacterium flavescens]|uniref:GNAT family N-acetyltransferase n=1 Tax=Leptobacterium flavescens TaxID=472055 RepID=A0A6P0UIV5_9FLAO|nr:GNAT family N-acetyltransferase [Leptobacterium flavescens]NER12917.1 GNAT family N-acetyltransferase [Leptobacterium flavescens]
MNIEIRKANPNDATLIALLGQVTFDDTFGDLFRDRQDVLDYMDRTFSVPKIRSSLQKDNNVFWIAFANELPVGYAKLKKISPLEGDADIKSAQLQKIYVLKDYLALKIGSKLQQEAIREAANSGADILWLSVLHTNNRAIHFYNKHKFVEKGKHHFTIGKEDFEFNIMMLHL